MKDQPLDGLSVFEPSKRDGLRPVETLCMSCGSYVF